MANKEQYANIMLLTLMANIANSMNRFWTYMKNITLNIK